MFNKIEVIIWSSLSHFLIGLSVVLVLFGLACFYAGRNLHRARQIWYLTASAVRRWLSGPETCDVYAESYLRKHIHRASAWIDAYIAIWSVIIASSFYWMNATVPFTALSFICSCALACYAIWALLKMNAESRQFKRDIEDSPWMKTYRLFYR